MHIDDYYNKHAYRILLGFALGAIAFGTVVFHFVERWSWLDAYYFSVVTLATVGYGDLTPHTPAGKLIATIYIFGGVGIFTAFVSYRLRRNSARFRGKDDTSS